MALVSIQP